MLRTTLVAAALMIGAWPAISAIDHRVVAAADNSATVKSGLLACVEAGQLQRARELISERDKEAYQRYVLPLARSGQCIFLAEGDRVFVEDTAAGRIQIRRQGDPSRYWTPRAAIDKLP
jgi:hypothetical protein